MRPSPLSLSLVLAIVAHAAMASAFYAATRPSSRWRAPAPPLELIEVTDETAPTNELEPTPAPLLTAAAPVPRVSPRAAAQWVQDLPAAAAIQAATDVPLPAASVQRQPAPPGGVTDLGIGDYWKSVAVSGSAGASPAEPPPASSGSRLPTAMEMVRDELRAGDRERGLGSAGPLVSAAHEAAAPSIAPDVGEALLDVVSDGDGKVVAVNVTGVLGDRSAWEDVARELARLMASKRLKVPAGSAGLRTRIRIRAQRVKPSGGQASVTGGVVDDEQCSGKGLSRKCFDGTVRTAGGRFDVADIGASARRVVHVEVVGEGEH